MAALAEAALIQPSAPVSTSASRVLEFIARDLLVTVIMVKSDSLRVRTPKAPRNKIPDVSR
jgi:hypothetical protein